MGMSAEQFFQVVLLPQGQFAQFLHARAQDKEALLQKLFGTGRFSQVADWLADRRRATDKEVSSAEETVAFLVAQLAQAADVQAPESGAVLANPELAGQVPAPGTPGAWQRSWAADLSLAAAGEQDAAVLLAATRRAELEAASAAMAHAERLAERQHRRHEALARQEGLLTATPELRRLPGDQASLRAAGQEQRAGPRA